LESGPELLGVCPVSPVRRCLIIGAAFLLAGLLLLLAESWLASVAPAAHPKSRLTILVPAGIVSVLGMGAGAGFIVAAVVLWWDRRRPGP
jgi:hypothetical protein